MDFCAILLLILITKCYGIGGPCRQANDCMAGQFCIDSICRCNNGEVLYNNHCVRNEYCHYGELIYHNRKCYYMSRIGENCQLSEQCYGNSLCFNGICTCPTGSYAASGTCMRTTNPCFTDQLYINNRCYDISQIGDRCVLTEQCRGGSVCVNQSCLCPFGMIQSGKICAKPNCSEIEVAVDGKCTSRSIPGQQCSSSAQCLDGAQCSTSEHFCVCPQGMNNIGGYCRKLSYLDPCDAAISVYVSGNCVSLQKPSGQCISNVQCLGGSSCLNGYCSCPSASSLINGYCVGSTYCGQNEIEANNRCFKLVDLNESCAINEQCPGSSFCNYAGLCECPPAMMTIGGRCRSSGNCRDTQVMVKNQCYDRRIPGDTCNDTEQCLDDSACIRGYCICPNNSYFLKGYCIKQPVSKCKAGQVIVDEQCLEVVPPGYRCNSNLQCLASSTCPRGICECSNDFLNILNYCVSTEKPPLQCGTTQVMLNSRCYEHSKINDYCIATEQCIGGSQCMENHCSCPEGTISKNGQCIVQHQCSHLNALEINGQCYNKVLPGQSCLYTEQCQNSSACRNDVCTCPIGTVLQKNVCIISARCHPNQIPINGRCYTIAYIGQYCQHSEQCSGGSECVNSQCACPSGTVAQGNQCKSNAQCNYGQIMINGLCYTLANIGEFCYYTDQCLGNAECNLNRCICPPRTVSLNGTCVVNANCASYQVPFDGRCLDTVTIGMICEDSSQCIATATCMNTEQQSRQIKSCQCVNGTVYNGSSCTASNVQCPPSTVYLSNEFCQSLVSMGQFCMYTVQCMGYSMCNQQICKCPMDFVAIRNVCRRQG